MIAELPTVAVTPNVTKRPRSVAVSSINDIATITVKYIPDVVFVGEDLQRVDFADDVTKFPLDSDGLIAAYTLAESIANRAGITYRDDISACRLGVDGSELRKWAESYVERGEDQAVANAAADYYEERQEMAKSIFFRALVTGVKIGRKYLTTSAIPDVRGISLRYVAANARDSWRTYSTRNSVESAIGYITRLLSEQEAADAKKQKDKDAAAKAKTAWTNPYKVGEILYRSYGYDETHYEFYQIVGMPTPKTMTVRRIKVTEAGEGRGTYWTMRPVKDDFASDKTETARIIVSHKRGQTYTSVSIDGEHYQVHEEGKTYYETY